jgi:hypothetical protein
MDNQHDRETGEEFHAEVSDVGGRRSPGVSTSRPLALAPSPAHPAPTRRWRALRLAGTLGAVALALLVILGSVPAVRDRVVGLIPTPTPTLSPGGDLFYLLPNPPGTTVLLDGHSLARLPLPGDPQPLRLARGRHRLEWRSAGFPFQPLSCTALVPPPPANTQINDSCPLVDPRLLPPGLLPTGSPAARASVIALHESFAALPNEQAIPLADTIQAALIARQSSATIQPDERYFYSPAAGIPGQVVTATQPLRTTLSLQVELPAQTGVTEPCFAEANVRPCRFPGQDCAQLCTWPMPVAPSGGTGPEWIAAALAQTSREYTALDGQEVAHNQYEFGLNLYLVMLRIRWDGTRWHVTPTIGHTPNLPPADDLLCGPALEWLSQPPLDFLFNTASAAYTTIRYASSATPVDGCVVRVVGAASGIPTPALFLERFGVLLAANDAAVGLAAPGSPRADASEQALAQQLAAQLTS